MAYYTPSGNPINQSRGIAASVRAEFALIQAGFAMLPVPATIFGATNNYGVDTGAANAYVVSIASTYLTAYADGLTIRVKITNANTTASTINLNMLGVKSIVRQDGTALQAGDLLASQIVELAYNATAGNFQLNASGAAASATAAAASAAAAAVSAGNASSSATAASGSATTASTQATNAGNSAIAAAASAALAAAYLTAGTSATSTLIATGSKSFTATTGKAWTPGWMLVLASAANVANYMHGIVTAYNSGTGALVVTVLDIGGSGTFADWLIGPTGTQGPTGPSGASSYPLTIVTGNTVVAVSNTYYTNTPGVVFTFPASPAVDAEIEIELGALATGCTILPNGKTWDTQSGTLNLDVAPLKYKWRYNATRDWL